jgi:hypothetical protein
MTFLALEFDFLQFAIMLALYQEWHSRLQGSPDEAPPVGSRLFGGLVRSCVTRIRRIRNIEWRNWRLRARRQQNQIKKRGNQRLNGA